MSHPLLLYSTNTYLAYRIAEAYYDHTHSVWCTPYFDARDHSRIEVELPPTSNPYEIYRNLHEEVERGDRHSSKIEQNRIGIKNGARIKWECQAIDDWRLRDIIAIVDQAQLRDFRPLLYVIRYDLVLDQIEEVPISQRANPTGREFRIETLRREAFDVLDLKLGGGR